MATKVLADDAAQNTLLTLQLEKDAKTYAYNAATTAKSTADGVLSAATSAKGAADAVLALMLTAKDAAIAHDAKEEEHRVALLVDPLAPGSSLEADYNDKQGLIAALVITRDSAKGLLDAKDLEVAANLVGKTNADGIATKAAAVLVTAVNDIDSS